VLFIRQETIVSKQMLRAQMAKGRNYYNYSIYHCVVTKNNSDKNVTGPRKKTQYRTLSVPWPSLI